MAATKTTIPASFEPALAALGLFNVKLFRALCLDASLRSQDIFTSSLNVLLAMTMAQAAAGAGSTTEAEIRAALCVEASEEAMLASLHELINALASADPDVKLAIANSTWAKGVKPEYVARMSETLGAEAFALPGDAAPINAWCAEKTAGLIPSILAQLDASVVAVLISAIYFKGAWSSVFQQRATKVAKFHAFDGELRCHMMKKTLKAKDKCYRYGAIGTVARGLELNYGSGRFRTLLALPNEPGEAALDATCEAVFGEGSYRDVVAGFNQPHDPIELSLPRFSSTFGTDLVNTFKALGVASAFSDADANFDRLTSASVHVSAIIHKAVLIVNEEGAEAAAVTAVSLEKGGAARECLVFAVDRPFVFAIVDSELSAVLFCGRIVHPKFDA